MENVYDVAGRPGEAKLSDFTAAVRARGDDGAARNGGNEENTPATVTVVSKVVGEMLSAKEESGGGPAPPKSAPAAMGLGQQQQRPQLPFRERNLEEGRRLLPPHIKVPPKKLFGYPERYRSPTDAMVSPVSRGLLTRNRRPGRTLAPVVPPKALENTFQETVGEQVAQTGSQ